VGALKEFFFFPRPKPQKCPQRWQRSPGPPRPPDELFYPENINRPLTGWSPPPNNTSWHPRPTPLVKWTPAGPLRGSQKTVWGVSPPLVCVAQWRLLCRAPFGRGGPAAPGWGPPPVPPQGDPFTLPPVISRQVVFPGTGGRKRAHETPVGKPPPPPPSTPQKWRKDPPQTGPPVGRPGRTPEIPGCPPFVSVRWEEGFVKGCVFFPAPPERGAQAPFWDSFMAGSPPPRASRPGLRWLGGRPGPPVGQPQPTVEPPGWGFFLGLSC